jgi:hypothetical protein
MVLTGCDGWICRSGRRSARVHADGAASIPQEPSTPPLWRRRALDLLHPRRHCAPSIYRQHSAAPLSMLTLPAVCSSRSEGMSGIHPGYRKE